MLKVLPQLIVKPEINQRPFELCSWNIVFSERTFGLNFVFGGLIGSHDNRFRLKQLWQIQDVPDALINLGKREVVVAIDVEIPEDNFPPGYIFSWVADGYIPAFLFDAAAHAQ